MVRPLLLAEPGPGDASCTIWTLSVFFHLLHFQAGRPSSRFAFRSTAVFQPLPSFQSSPVFQPLPAFRSSPALRPLQIFRTSPVIQLLPILRSSSVFRPLRSSCDPNLSIGGLLCNGGFKLLLRASIVKSKNEPVRAIF
jgi:hypothetical protein